MQLATAKLLGTRKGQTENASDQLIIHDLDIWLHSVE